MKRNQPFALAAVLLAAGTLLLSGCGRRPAEGSEQAAASGAPRNFVIGAALPQKTSENWVLAETLFNDGLAKAGFTPDVQFANGGVTDQQNQIAAMVTKGAKVIVIGSIDGSQLGTQVKAAHNAGISVIAYDRLIKNTSAVDYFVAFDDFKVGQLQGRALLEGMAKKKPKGPYNIELFAGSPDDSNAKGFFDGAMSVIKPKMDDGTVKVPSGQLQYNQAVTQGWKAENAQRRADTLLAANYTKAELDGVLSPNDTLARAILASVKSAGKPYPVITGQDSEVESVKAIMQGVQYATIYKDTRKLVAETVAMTKALTEGGKPKVTDDKSYDNGAKIVPANLLLPVIVTKENAAEVYKDDPILGPLTRQQ